MGFQGGQSGVERPPQPFIPRDKGIDLHAGRLQHPGALAEKIRVQAGLRAGIKVVDGDDIRSCRRQDPGLLLRGGRGIDRHRHPGGQGAGLFQGEAVIQAQAPQAQPLRQLRDVPAAQLPGRHLGHIRQDAPALPAQPAAHFPHTGGVVGGKFFPDMQ